MKYNIDSQKFRIKPNKKYIRLIGWCFDEQGAEIEFTAKADGKEKEVDFKALSRPDVQAQFAKRYNVSKYSGFSIRVYFDAEEKTPEDFALFAKTNREKRTVIRLNRREIVNMTDDSSISYNVDGVTVANGEMAISGWANSLYGLDSIKYIVRRSDGWEVDNIRFKKLKRSDVVEADLVREEDVLCGFSSIFKCEPEDEYIFTISDDHNEISFDYKVKNVIRKNKRDSRKKKAARLIRAVNAANVKEVLSFTKKHGVVGAIKYVRSRIHADAVNYEEWYQHYRPDDEELKKQKSQKFNEMPLISILVPAYKTPERLLREMIGSVTEQTYGNWELCIADASENETDVKPIVAEFQKKDSRVKYKLLEKNLSIPENTNAAMEMAEGDIIALLDHDDTLEPHALYEIVKAVNEDPEIDVIYTDEDKLSFDGMKHLTPYFKSDFNQDLLCSNNYICHLFAVRSELAERVGGFRKEYNGSQDHDFILRCCEIAKKIHHIPKALYHWRLGANSTAENPESKMYCFEAEKNAIQAHYDRMGYDCRVDLHKEYLGLYTTTWNVQGNPLVSIIIPNKDEAQTLKTCIDSIKEKSTYENYEIIIVENNSTTEEIFEYYKELENDEKIRVVIWEKEFNYSAINNFGESFAKGDYILLLNNDIEVITPDWLEKMVGQCQRKEVGAVGAKLIYPDGTVQHAGVIIGVGGVAGHAFVNLDRDEPGYFSRAILQQDLSAVTAACLMVKKSVFEELNGLEEKIKVAFNDVDLCLRIREAGYLIVFEPNVQMYHYESKSRGYEDTPEKQKRFMGEVYFMKDRWEDFLKKGDPYYNENLTLCGNTFDLKRYEEDMEVV